MNKTYVVKDYYRVKNMEFIGVLINVDSDARYKCHATDLYPAVLEIK